MGGLLKINSILIFLPVFYIGCLNNVHSQNTYCDDSSAFRKANKLYRDAVLDSIKIENNTVSLLKKATEIDTSFTQAWFTLGKIYHKKAIQSQYDLLMYPHARFYFKKAEDCFYKVINLCEGYKDYSASYYLGEIYFLTKEYSLSGYYLEKFILNNNSNNPAYIIAQDYLKKYLKWKDWQENPWQIEFYPIHEICTPADELYHAIPYSVQNIYFTRQQTRQQKNSIYLEHVNEFYKAEIDGVDTLGNPIFSNTQLIDIPGYHGSFQHEITISPNNRELYYTHFEKIKIDNKYVEICSIWFTSFDNDSWETPVKLNQNINFPESSNGYPFLSFDGNTLYFSSNRPDSYGGYDIFKSEKQEKGKWGIPENLGTQINTINNEITPFLSFDDINLYFSSDGHFGLGGYDIFRAVKNNQEQWSIPENMGKPINTNSDDIGFQCDARGNTGYIASNRLIGNGGWDIFSFEIPSLFRPTESIIVNGKFKIEQEIDQQNIHFNLKDLATGSTINTLYNPEEQVFSAFLPKNTRICILTIEEPEYGFSTKIQPINSKSNFAYIPVILKRQNAGTRFQLEGFQLNKMNKLSEISKLIFLEFINYLQKNKDIKFKIYLSRSSESGDEDYKNSQLFLAAMLNDNGINSIRYSFETIMDRPANSNYSTLEIEIINP